MNDIDFLINECLRYDKKLAYASSNRDRLDKVSYLRTNEEKLKKYHPEALPLLNELREKAFYQLIEKKDGLRLDISYCDLMFSLLDNKEIIHFIDENKDNIVNNTYESKLLFTALNLGNTEVAKYCIDNLHKSLVGQNGVHINSCVSVAKEMSHHLIQGYLDFNIFEDSNYTKHATVRNMMAKTSVDGLAVITNNMKYYLGEKNSQNGLFLFQKLLSENSLSLAKDVMPYVENIVTKEKHEMWNFYIDLLDKKELENTMSFLEIIKEKYGTLDLSKGGKSLINQAVKYKSVDVVSFILNNGGDYKFNAVNSCKSAKNQLSLEIKKWKSNEGDQDIPLSFKKLEVLFEKMELIKSMKETGINVEQKNKKRL